MIYGTPSGAWEFPTTDIGTLDLNINVDRLLFNIGKPFTTNLGDSLTGLSFTIGPSDTELITERYEMQTL